MDPVITSPLKPQYRYALCNFKQNKKSVRFATKWDQLLSSFYRVISKRRPGNGGAISTEDVMLLG